MDTFENSSNTDSQDTSPVKETIQNPESPFADAPFEMPHSRETEMPAPSNIKKRGSKIFVRILAAMLVVCLIAGGCGAAVMLTGAYWEGKMEQQKASLQSQINRLQAQVNSLEKTQIVISGNENDEAVTLTPAQIYALCVRGVVSVSTGASFGSGFLISADGYVVTNYHVVEGASSLTVTTFSEQEYSAKVVGYDNANDLALLKINASDLPYLEVGSSSGVNVGDQVVTIGNPLGELSHSLSTGYVSATDRVVVSEGNKINMIQIDATINSGNSGGPLLNMQGQVVGITSAKYSGTTSNGAIIEGIGFAIPMDDVSGILSDLKTYGYVTGPYLGVAVRDVESSVIQNYGLPSGAYVDSVVKDVSAARAGVQAKDIIIAIGEYEVTCVTDLTRVLRNFKAGDTTTITVYRAGAQLQLTITLDEKPRN